MPLRWSQIPEGPYLLAIGPAPGGGSSPSLDADLGELRTEGFGQLVCLLEEQEVRTLAGEPDLWVYETAVQNAGLEFVHMPVEDFCAPGRSQIAAIAEAVGQATAASRPTYVHCMAGLGRAGTVAACLLVQAGMAPRDAILLVRWARPGAIQSAEQEALVHRLGAQR